MVQPRVAPRGCTESGEQMYPDRIEIAYTADDFERIAANEQVAADGR